MISRRSTLKLAALAGVSLAGGALLAGRSGLRVTRHQLTWPLGRPLRVVHLTDIHVGWTTPRSLLSTASRRARELSPDLVVLTGDYVNHSLLHLDVLERWVASLPGPCLATLGNHDHWSGAAEVRAALEGGGARVLSNQATRVHDLLIVGVDDGRTRNDDVPRAFHGVDPAEQVLVLQHCPRLGGQLAARGARLVLSGHTHAGQVGIPKLTRALLRRAGQPYVAGAFHLGESLLYVNAGLGHSRCGLRWGHGTAPELAVFDLLPAG